MEYSNNKIYRYTYANYSFLGLQNNYIVWAIYSLFAILGSFVLLAGLSFPLWFVFILILLEGVSLLGIIFYRAKRRGIYYNSYKVKQKEFPEIITK